MATVTVVTAERTLEIEATSIVDGEINAAGHLILTRHDGTPIDMGAVSGMQMNDGMGYEKVDAFSYIGGTDPGAVPNGSVWYDTNDVAGPISSATQKGLVELATSAETDAMTDATRAVTPAGMANKVNGITTRLTNLEGTQTKVLTGVAESATPASYPTGLSVQSVTSGSGWSLNGGYGAIVTHKISMGRTEQTFYASNGGTNKPRFWTRTFNDSDGGGGWTSWVENMLLVSLDPAVINQSSPISAYPYGYSRMYLSATASTGWTFAGKYGELITFRDGTDFASQVWTRHAGPYLEIMNRSANAAGGWTAWETSAFVSDVVDLIESVHTKLPKAILSGRATVSQTPNTQYRYHVNFPAGYFTATPNVTVSADSIAIGDTLQGVGMTDASATGFDIIVRRSNDTNTLVQWTAIQMA